MHALPLDDDVVAFIRSQAIPWTDSSPSDTIRRLLGIERKPTAATPGPLNSEHQASRQIEREPKGASGLRKRARQRKADLYELQRVGALHEGQTLYLHDYSGKRIPDAEAQIGGVNKLIMKGHRYSMSSLASRLLKKHGYAADAVRGPAHWHTTDGVSVRTLWERHLDQIGG